MGYYSISGNNTALTLNHLYGTFTHKPAIISVYYKLTTFN